MGKKNKSCQKNCIAEGHYYIQSTSTLAETSRDHCKTSDYRNFSLFCLFAFICLHTSLFIWNWHP